MPVSETGALTAWRHPNKMAGIGRLEHPRTVLETAALPVKLYPYMMMVMPAGLEPSITSLRGLRPDQLDEGTILEIRVGFEPTINSFAGYPLQPLEYRIMVGIVGFEPTVPASKAGALSAWPYPIILEIRAGLEPVIAAVKGLCPNHLDERTVWREAELLVFKRRRCR